MKKYKLLKKYPSLPRTMVVGLTVEWNESMELYHHSTTLDTFHSSEIEFYPEFWQEVVPKKYKILSFEANDSGGCMHTTLRPNGKYLNSKFPNDDGHFELDFVLTQPHWKIHKVKRLSDGKVFTVGDVVVRHADENCDTPNPAHRKITKFYVEENDPDMMFKSGKDEGFIIDLFSHIKPKIIFTTEDGLYAYEGYTVYMVSLVERAFNIHPSKARKELLPVPSYFKYFSTRKAAENFVMMNKPVLSLVEIYQIMSRNSTGLAEYTHSEKLYRYLKEAAKKKLK